MMQKVLCHFCSKEYSPFGIHTHIARAHGTEEEKSKYSSGNHGHYHEQSFKEKISNSLNNYWKNSGKLISEKNCIKCNKLFKSDKNVRFCSKSCASKRARTLEEKIKIGNSLRIELKQSICKNCNKSFKHKRKTRQFCTSKCYYSFRTKYDENGKLSLHSYRTATKFNFSLNQYPNEFDFDLIRKHGWYSARNRGNNLNGVSRDHIVPVTYGWTNDIDPAIINHPANCQLLIHNDNVSKGNKLIMTLKELEERIREWDKKYPKR